MNPKAILLILLVCSTVIYSCKKKETVAPAPTFPRELTLKQITKNSEIQVFSNNIEITDPKIKEKFLRNSSAYFNLEVKAINKNEKISFSTPDSAKFSTATGNYYVVTLSDQFTFLAKPVAATDRIIYTYLPFSLNSSASTVLDRWRTDRSTHFTEVREAKGDFNSLNLSVISYKIKRGGIPDAVSLIQSGIVYQNHSGIPRNLTVYDTLAVQQFTATYTVK